MPNDSKQFDCFTFDADSKRGYGRITIKDFINEYLYRIDLDADYQRNPVWSLKDQELLLDSILYDIDIPKLYLAIISNNNQFDYECIDGKQRIVALAKLYKPEEKGSLDDQGPLKVKFYENKFTLEELRAKHPTVAQKIDNYQLDLVAYRKEDFEDNEDYIRLIFKRLNLGVELNSGEKLKAKISTVKDFVFTKIGQNGPFLKNTSLSAKRFSREFTVAQIVVNSFKKKETGKYSRVRLPELEQFFEDNYKLPLTDENFVRVLKVLEAMEVAFGGKAVVISSRAAATAAYFAFESLYEAQKSNLFSDFVEFYAKLLEEVKANLQVLRKDLNTPKNKMIIEEFQKYIAQASAEATSFERREKFLKKAFEYFLDPKTKGEIIGNK